MHRRTRSRLSLKPLGGVMSLPMPFLYPFGSPKKHRVKHRTALIALLSLFTFTCYLLFVAYPSLSLSRSLLTRVQDHPTHVHEEHLPSRPSTKYRKVQQHLRPVPPPRLALALTHAEELAALSAFIAALPYNVLPPTVDPDLPLDPQLVLDFDPRSESAREELDRLVEQVWSRFPVILFAKVHSSDSREVRHMLSGMQLSPAPLIIEVDQREDAQVLQPLLTRLTHVPSLPLLLIGGQAVGSGSLDAKGVITDIRKLHEDGELSRRMLEAGAYPHSEKRKGRGRRRAA